MGDSIVVRGDAPEVVGLLADGWVVSERSFGAQLDPSRVDRAGLEALVAAAPVSFRALTAGDRDAVLTLDAATAADYPGGPATRHEPLDAARATPSRVRRAFGASDAGAGADAGAGTGTGAGTSAGETVDSRRDSGPAARVSSATGSLVAGTSGASALVAMTFLDVAAGLVETAFTVVAREHRGRGIGTALKAYSVLTLLDEGAKRFRTGGSSDNAAIIAADERLGYVRDEEWLTLVRAG